MRRGARVLPAVVAAALVLAACGSAGGGPKATEASLADTITIGIEQAPDSYNADSADSNSVYNAYVDNLTQQGFVRILPDGSVEPNPTFGTYTKVSDDPLTVKYTFADAAVWSDGTPIDFDDALLSWAAHSGSHPSAELDADGNPTDLFNPSSTSGWADVAMPVGKAGDKSFTLTFTTPYADWEVLGLGFLPAHVAAAQGGLSAAGNGAALVAAIENDDVAALTPVAKFWNTGWAYQESLPALPAAALIPSSGPYSYGNAADGTLTLVRNPKWWGDAAKTASIVFKAVDPAEMVQALANGEIDSFDPTNPTADMLAQLVALGAAVKVEKGQSLTYSHIDLDSSSSGLFADARVRTAFLKCVPRQELVDKFATPIDPDSTVLDLHEYLPSQPEYRSVLDQVPAAKAYDGVDLAGARALLAQAGVATPLTVRVLRASQSALRGDQVALIKASCDQAGFTIVDQADADSATTRSQRGQWDASIFGWSGSGLVTANETFYTTGGGQNFGGYSDATVDDLWSQIVKVTSRADAVPLKVRLEQELWANPYNVLLYANPGLTAFSAHLTGPGYNPTQYGSTWNAQTWTKTR